MFKDFSVAVYCASSAKVDPAFLNAAKEVGEIFHKQGIHCIFGAGSTGLMGALADEIVKGKGNITGLIPQFMVDRNWHHKKITNLLITKTIHERKEKMASMANAAIALPGGCGTLEELLEIITWKQLGLFQGAIIIVNINGYYNPLIEMLNKAIDEQFMSLAHAKLWSVVNSPKEILSAIKNTTSSNQNDLNFAVV